MRCPTGSVSSLVVRGGASCVTAVKYIYVRQTESADYTDYTEECITGSWRAAL
jgi:hypothetical protein